MLIDDYNGYAKNCFRDCPPPCTSACPLGLDVRALIDKIRRSNFNAAYRIYRNKVLFPSIVSRICPQPCRQVCVRNNIDESILLRTMEAAVVENAKNTDPIQYNVPAKPFTVAIIGAGLSGLSCALKMAARNYSVKVYEKDDKIGGALWGLLEPDIFLNEIEKQFANVEYDLFTSHPVDSLKSITADAFYIATGHGGTDFGLADAYDRNSLGTKQQGVFVGGGLLGKNSIESIEHGVRASYSIEKYLKVGAMDGVPETYSRSKILKAFYNIPFEAEPSAIDNQANISAQSAVDESRRCRMCNCSLCHDSCELMQHSKTFPPKMVTDVISTLGPKESITQRVGMKMINGCTQCGLCKDICPEVVDMESCLLEARRSLHSDGVMPPAYRDFWLRDMNFSNEEAFFCYQPQAGEKMEYMFFPGCQLGASEPEYVFKTYDYLRKICPETALLQACCSVPADWAGDTAMRDQALEKISAQWNKAGRPIMILACPTCIKTFKKYLPECKIISLYAILSEHFSFQTELPQKCVSVYDPCSSRGDAALQGDVRKLIRQAGFEIDDSVSQAQCCGFGGHIQMADAKLFNMIVEKRIAQTENEYITYCTNCRDIFVSSGKASRHMLDILFTGNALHRRPPSLTQRRRNRVDIKKFFMAKEDIDYNPFPEKEDFMELIIPSAMQDKMNRLFILEEEVKAVINHCQSSGEKTYNKVTGQYVGYKQIGVMTYWVIYSDDDGALTLNNVYSHRMTIEST